MHLGLIYGHLDLFVFSRLVVDVTRGTMNAGMLSPLYADGLSWMYGDCGGLAYDQYGVTLDRALWSLKRHNER